MTSTSPPESRPSTLERFPAWRSVTWPGGARVAVQLLLAFEAFEEHSQFTTEAGNGVNPFSISYGEYGAHVGAWRLLQLLEDEGVVGSVAINGKAADAHPYVVKAMAERGHELVGHAWANDRGMPGGDAERELVARTLEAIERAGGVRPVGWTSPGKMGSPDSDEILLDAGIRYTGDDASDDLPFVRSVGSRRIAVVPSTDLASNDLLHWVLRGQPPSTIVDGFKTTFDAVYEEALQERPGMVGLVLHCHGAGRPTLVPAVRELIRYCKRHAGVWFARGDEIANVALREDSRR
ncbi:polysaccharide deacetylase family protein [Conexibacter sp. CPCC 206217]|uniref:polysaccharide deacetylase family protein n=1 Tax=Conexibacter sp. CPCC 206217 TaxID=3064574 RepID=UPI00271886AE|nr:polysaccharide deacetylase family protein [Conexibacter sp. CPCC 206217]MDO8212055.1 polysaccharide deacetylase family protein [Conexibacter sp. CPCC 206217]